MWFAAICSGASFAALGACADDSEPALVQNDASITLDAPMGAADSATPIVDAGCDSADPSCVSTMVSCDAVAWCIVPSTVSPYYVLKAVWGTAPNDVWAAGSGGTIVHFDGTTWTASTSGIPNTFNSIWGSGPEDIYIVSSNTAILHGTGTHGGPASGATWTKLTPDLDPSDTVAVNAVWGSGANDVHLGGSHYYDDDGNDSDGFLHTAAKPDAGDAGYWAPTPGTALVNGIWGSSATDIWMVADNSQWVPFQYGLTLHGKPGEAGPLELNEVDSQSNDPLESVHGTSANDVWAVGAGGTIRHIGSSDVRWQIVESNTTARLHSVFAIAPNDVWFVGDDATILHFDGTSVKVSDAQLPLGPKPSLYGVWGSGPNDVWIVGDGVVLHYTGPKAGGDQ